MVFKVKEFQLTPNTVVYQLSLLTGDALVQSKNKDSVNKLHQYLSTVITTPEDILGLPWSKKRDIIIGFNTTTLDIYNLMITHVIKELTT